MQKDTCCFSGHRDIPAEHIESLRHRMFYLMEDLVGRGFTRFECGGAIGFDTLAAKAVIGARMIHPEIKLVLVLPHRNQTARWSNPRDVETYEGIKRLANEVIYVCEEYVSDCFHRRNRRMVDDSALLVCYHSRAAGGTAYTVGYAYDCGREIINMYLGPVAP